MANADEGPLDRPEGRPELRSLEQIKQSGVVRILVRNNATSFLIYRGHRMGFDYELGKRLAQSLGIRAQFVVPRTWDDILPALLRGDGDVVAGEMTATADRSAQVLFAQPYATTTERVVYSKKGSPVAAAEELSGKKVRLRRSSAYWQTLEALNRRLAEAGKASIELDPAPEDAETEDLLDAVARGDVAYTIADELLAKPAVAARPQLVLGPALGDPRPLAWAVRPGAADLAAAIDAMFKAEKKGPEFNVWKKQYFETPRQLAARQNAAFDKSGKISPYDKLITASAKKYGFDWRLVAAQVYQESQFDPKRTSWCGAQGLFQIMPDTAKLLGIDDPFDPAQGIEGGCRYMSKLIKMFDDVADPAERYKLALAAYNCGPGHVQDARSILQARHEPAETWAEVRPAMLELSQEKVHGQTRYGYCRCTESVAYVQKILERFDGYKQLTAGAE
jgi:membrane-bound lytic murein transglycosylase F